MSTNFNNIASSIRSILSASTNPLLDNEKNNLLAIAIARALSIHFHLPTSPVSSVNIHFTTCFDELLQRVLSAFNEHIIINTQLTRDLTFKFYKLRYDLVHTPRAFEKTIPLIAAVLPDYFPEEICKIMTNEVQRELKNENYWATWANLVGTIAEGINVALSENVTVPVDSLGV